jgi:hypothetical protein
VEALSAPTPKVIRFRVAFLQFKVKIAECKSLQLKILTSKFFKCPDLRAVRPLSSLFCRIDTQGGYPQLFPAWNGMGEVAQAFRPAKKRPAFQPGYPQT